MKSGIYALASLDGSSLNPEDLELLGFSQQSAATGSRKSFYGRAVDELPAGHAIDIVDSSGESMVFLGYLNELEEIRPQLTHQSPIGSAYLTKLALERFGAEAAWKLIGDYSFLRWDARARELTLFTSQRIRDQLYWVTNGKHLAVSSDLLLLTKLPWVGRTLDTVGFALTMSDYRLRRIRTTETMWSGVARLPAGWSARINASEKFLTALSPPPTVKAWNGTFEEAVEEVTRIGRRIVGQQMVRYGRTAFLLSGGLDSSLTTVLGSMERQTADSMFCLTSVAPQGSGIPDEWEISRLLAKSLEVSIYPVEADGAQTLKLPQSFSGHYGMPPLGPRQHLYEALQEAALCHGSHLITDGVGGEFTISAARSYVEPSWPRKIVHKTRRLLRGHGEGAGLQSLFIIGFSPDFLRTLPESWSEVASATSGNSQTSVGKYAYLGARRSADVETSAVGGTRYLYPYLDHRLLRFAGSLPTDYFFGGPVERKLARAALRKRAPQEIVDRSIKLPFSPTYLLDLQKQSTLQKPRVALLRDAGLDEIFDLEWLEGELSVLAQGSNPYPKTASAQITCLAGEFLLKLADNEL